MGSPDIKKILFALAAFWLALLAYIIYDTPRF